MENTFICFSRHYNYRLMSQFVSIKKNLKFLNLLLNRSIFFSVFLFFRVDQETSARDTLPPRFPKLVKFLISIFWCYFIF